MNYHSLPLKWQPAHRFQTRLLPHSLRDWLLEPNSLTQRLQLASNNQLKVKIENTKWEKPRADEMSALNLQAQKMWVRKTALMVQEQTWILARTIVPRNTMVGKGRRLQSLGTRPLGELLYQDSNLCRTALEIATIPAGYKDYQWACNYLSSPPTQLWARRSLFYFYQRPLLVMEIFLPNGVFV